jgi:competence ComEA-like helix-hairpin-helix protein
MAIAISVSIVTPLAGEVLLGGSRVAIGGLVSGGPLFDGILGKVLAGIIQLEFHDELGNLIRTVRLDSNDLSHVKTISGGIQSLVAFFWSDDTVPPEIKDKLSITATFESLRGGLSNSVTRIVQVAALEPTGGVNHSVPYDPPGGLPVAITAITKSHLEEFPPGAKVVVSGRTQPTSPGFVYITAHELGAAKVGDSTFATLWDDGGFFQGILMAPRLKSGTSMNLRVHARAFQYDGLCLGHTSDGPIYTTIAPKAASRSPFAIAPSERTEVPITHELIVNINVASDRELKALPGVGPVLAKMIIAHQPFKSVEDLMGVPGIGRARFAKLRDHVRISWN